MGDTTKTGKWVENVDGFPTAESLGVTIKTGDAVFYYPNGKNQTLSIPGEVVSQASGILKQGLNLIGSGFPVSWNPNDEGTAFWGDNKFKKNTTYGGSDQIRVWVPGVAPEGNKYRYFFLYNKMGDTTKSKKWVENVDDLPVLEEPIKTDRGFFYYRQNSGQIVFEPPSLHL